MNSNTSRLPCLSDGEPYTVRATLVGRRDVLATGRALTVTVYVPSFGFGSYWKFGAVPGYDYASAMAAAGHVSLVYDPLGYGASDKPPGQQTCLGSAADVLHQVVDALKDGDYTLAGGKALSFDHVVLASHTSGALITQPAAYSYGDIDGLIVTSWADSGFTDYFARNTAESSVACAAGGEPSEGDSGPSGYTFIPPRARFVGTYFVDAEDTVVAAAADSQRRAPCGDFASAGTGNAENQLLLSDVRVPVLLVYGEKDAMWNHPSAGEQHRDRFTGASSVDLVFVADAGGAVALERSGALRMRSTAARWLCENGLAPEAACPAAVTAPGRGAPAPDSAAGASGEEFETLPVTGLSTIAPVGMLAVAVVLGVLARKRDEAG